MYSYIIKWYDINNKLNETIVKSNSLLKAAQHASSKYGELYVVSVVQK